MCVAAAVGCTRPEPQTATTPPPGESPAGATAPAPLHGPEPGVAPVSEPPHVDHGPEPGLGTAPTPPPEPVPEPVVPVVELTEPELTQGEVSGLDKKLDGSKSAVRDCVGEHDGLLESSGFIKVQFLVQGAGKAEGVEVLDDKGVSDAALECVKKYWKSRAVGSPSVEPIGVTVRYKLRSP